MTLRNLRKFFSGKTVLAAVLPLLCLAAALPAFSQTAEIRAAGVYYEDNTNDPNGRYCNWGNGVATTGNYKGAVTNVGNHQTNDPWDTSALIEYDQPYPSPKTPNKYPTTAWRCALMYIAPINRPGRAPIPLLSRFSASALISPGITALKTLLTRIPTRPSAQLTCPLWTIELTDRDRHLTLATLCVALITATVQTRILIKQLLARLRIIIVTAIKTMLHAISWMEPKMVKWVLSV